MDSEVTPLFYIQNFLIRTDEMANEMIKIKEELIKAISSNDMALYLSKLGRLLGVIDNYFYLLAGKIEIYGDKELKEDFKKLFEKYEDIKRNIEAISLKDIDIILSELFKLRDKTFKKAGFLPQIQKTSITEILKENLHIDIIEDLNLNE